MKHEIATFPEAKAGTRLKIRKNKNKGHKFKRRKSVLLRFFFVGVLCKSHEGFEIGREQEKNSMKPIDCRIGRENIGFLYES